MVDEQIDVDRLDMIKNPKLINCNCKYKDIKDILIYKNIARL